MKMFFWREIQDEGIDADVTFEPKQTHGVLKPFFASVGKIVEVFRGFWNDDRKGLELCSKGEMSTRQMPGGGSFVEKRIVLSAA